jgi:DNA-binding response OmpR family regulator
MSISANILVVDDEPRICRLLDHYLTQEQYKVHTASNGEDMRRLLGEEHIDLVILDLMLPHEDGFSLAREVLRAYSDVAIIILTGKTESIDKVVGLELGADDYMTKPFHFRELLARVRSVLRRVRVQAGSGTVPEHSIVHFAGWRFDLTAQELKSPAGNDLRLTAHEFQLLSAFVKNPNHVLTRDAIMNLISGREWAPFDRSIDVLIAKLRKKLQDDTNQQTVIRTVRGVGYKFVAKVDYRRPC